MSDQTTRAAIEAVWRLESTRLVAGLVRIVRDVGFAEDLAQDALVAALAQWPHDGIPQKPAAWLMTTAKRRAVDRFRRQERQDRAYGHLAQDLEQAVEDDLAAAVDHVEDDVLRLMFICCHPSLSPEARTTLTLKLVGGLSAREIARAYLTSEATIAQRVVRAKRTLADSGAALEEPAGDERDERLASVLAVVYLMFNEGYAATAGDDWTRPTLCEEAVRLGRILSALVPDDAEVHGLSALMEFQSSRLDARVGPGGEPVLLTDQDRDRWDRSRVNRGEAALARAGECPGEPGPYVLQAAIAACHASAPSAEETDWEEIARLYEHLGRITGSPVTELNRAVALGMARGPAAGLALVDQLAEVRALRGYHYLPSVRGDLLEKLGRHDEARAEFERALSLTANHRERELLARRARSRPGPAQPWSPGAGPIDPGPGQGPGGGA